MSDLISRQDVLRICDKYNGHGWVWSMIRKEVDDLPCDGCCTAHSGYEAGMNRGMTREEAINHLKTVAKSAIDSGYDSAVVDAVVMATKALEQEPCEDEYIKVPKKALKYRTKGMVAYNAEWLKNHFDIERAVICGVQEPKTGHWIYDRTRDWDGECKYECSECGMGSDVDYAYCMRCGAKMVESQERSDKE